MSERTTITLEDDVIRRVREEMRHTGRSFKETVNTMLRRGLDRPAAEPPRERYRVEPVNLGMRPGQQLDCVWQLLEETEGPDYR
ncbi:MAG TPA: hypothetical protein VLJ59_13925 [Mycobacteriales bacterium]|nr:hypothetical protein [Mycobacteriales bacterium]